MKFFYILCQAELSYIGFFSITIYDNSDINRFFQQSCALLEIYEYQHIPKATVQRRL